MKLQGNSVSNLKDWEQLRRYSAINFQNIAQVVNGNLAFGDNLQGTGPLEFKVTSANQIVQINFNLPYVPSNFIVCFKNAASDIYVPNVAQYPWTQTAAFLTASAVVTARVIIF